MDKQITFFTAGTKKCEQAVKPIAGEAKRRGIETEFSDDPLKDAEIGIYTTKVLPYHPRSNTDLSVFLFHGLDSAYESGPIRYNWSRFDVGLLSGQAAADRWQTYSQFPTARPRIGAFRVGWPKSDPLFTDSFRQEVDAYAESLDLTKDGVVLYAPTYECGGKLSRIADIVDTSQNDLLIKHGDYDEGQYLDDTSLTELYTHYSDKEGITILDTADNILFALAIADIVISDSDSVLLEALLTETSPVTVTDWPVTPDSKRGSSAVSSSVTELTDAELGNFFSTPEYCTAELDDERNYHFDNLGTSATVTVDLLVALATGTNPPVEPLLPAEIVSRRRAVANRTQNTVSLALSSILVRLSESQQQWIRESNLHHIAKRLVKVGTTK